MDIRIYLNEISEPNEKWVQCREYPDFWVSSNNRVVSFKCNRVMFIKVVQNQHGDFYFRVNFPNGKAERVYLNNIVYGMQIKEDIENRIKKSKANKDKDDKLNLAEYWALELLGSVDHPDYSKMVHKMYECAIWNG